MDIERLMPETEPWAKYYSNHITRYQFAIDRLDDLKSKTILDVACGVGYGARFIADNGAQSIYAIDIADEALEYANRLYVHKKIQFIKDNCETLNKIPKNLAFDAIVSFETLEHLRYPKVFLKRIFELLKINGTLVISTPNINVTNHLSKNDWKFHEKEYTANEFFTLLQSVGFNEIQLFGQHYSQIGVLRNQIRTEINRINFNPLVRFGYWIQKKVRQHYFAPVLPEQIEDFEFSLYPNPKSIVEKGVEGPFVMIAIAQKKPNSFQ
jgi:cyclopropane fatty-acyl-phospholipid synthase-like methyltransferase